VKYLARVGALLLSISLVACASATKRGGGDPVDLALSTSSDDLAPPPRTSERDFSFFEPDFATPAPTTDLAGADLAAPPDMTPPRDLATPADMVAGGDMSGGGLPANAGDTCANAPLLPTGVDVTNQDTTPLTDDYDIGTSPSTACSLFGAYVYDGRDGAYRIVIPAGKTLTVLLTKSNLPTIWDPALALVTDCSNMGPTCLAGSDNVTGLTETVTYKNNGASPITVYVIVEAFNPDQYGKYTIRADLM
jgi:hypothetical protein